MGADRRPMLQELLKHDQEPFHLKSYIAERRSELRKPLPDSSLQRFSGGGEAFLRIPSGTAAILVEAAMRIQKQRVWKPETGLFGSFRFLKRNHRKARVKINAGETRSGSDSSGFAASTSSRCLKDMIDEDYTSPETQFGWDGPLSPVRFSLRRSLSYAGIPGERTPDFTSPAASPSHPVSKEDEEYDSNNPRTSAGEEQEEKEQCSPVSILDDTPFDEGGHVSQDEEEDDEYELECGYANIQRAKQQLLHRLMRFEKLAGLDPFELERRIIESPDEEFDHESTEKLELCDESFDDKSFGQDRCKIKIWTDEKVCDVAFKGRVQNRLDSWKEVEVQATVGSMIDQDFENDLSRWRRPGQNGMEEVMVEMELEVFDMLVEEFSAE